jgi:hypothetical protein
MKSGVTNFRRSELSTVTSSVKRWRAVVDARSRVHYIYHLSMYFMKSVSRAIIVSDQGKVLLGRFLRWSLSMIYRTHSAKHIVENYYEIENRL